MTDTLAVAVIQYEPLPGRAGPGADGPAAIRANAAEHVRLIEDAAAHGSRFVLFPELSLTGHGLDALAERDSWLVPGDPRLDNIRDICRRTGITAVVGAACREADGTRRLASLALHPDGATEAAYKTHLDAREQDLFVAGSGTRVIEVDGWRLALASGSDAIMPAASTLPGNGTFPGKGPFPRHTLLPGNAAGGGTIDACCVPGSYTRNVEHRLALHLEAQAMDNGVYLLFANTGGTTAAGQSCGLSGIWAPDGLPV